MTTCKLLLAFAFSANLLSPIGAKAQTGSGGTLKQPPDAVFMSNMSSRMPDRITYEYAVNQPTFPRRVVLELQDIISGDTVVGRVPKSFRVFGCKGPTINLNSIQFSTFEGFFRGFSVNATNDGRFSCDTRNLSIAFETSRIKNGGGRTNFYYGLIIASDGKVGFEVEEIDLID